MSGAFTFLPTELGSRTSTTGTNSSDGSGAAGNEAKDRTLQAYLERQTDDGAVIREPLAPNKTVILGRRGIGGFLVTHVWYVK